VQEASGDPALRGDLAVAYGKLASLQSEGGSLEEALAVQRKSAALFQELAAVDPEHSQHQKGLALSQNNLGLLLVRMEGVEQAQEQFTAAIARQQRLLSRFPQDSEVASDLAASLVNLGQRQKELGLTAEARASFEEAIEVLKEHGPDPRKLAAAENSLASMLAEPERAIQLYEQAVELLDAAVRRLPLDELAALERLELRDPLLPPLPLPLLRLLLRLLCDSRCLLSDSSDSPCSLTSPSSIVPRHSPSGSGFIIA